MLGRRMEARYAVVLVVVREHRTHESHERTRSKNYNGWSRAQALMPNVEVIGLVWGCC